MPLILDGTSGVSASGNVTGAFLFGNASTVTGLSASKIFNGTTEANVGSSGGNITFTVAGTAIAGISTEGIINQQSNGVGNIGSATTYFNTVFAKATGAQYADLAENYVADQEYPVGTVIMIGGAKEVRSSSAYHSTKIIGTVSDKPAYIMNSGLQAEHVVTVALTGRVPCQVVGTIQRGDLLVASELHGIATVLDPVSYQPGCVIGKALEEYNSEVPGIIEIVVGKI